MDEVSANSSFERLALRILVAEDDPVSQLVLRKTLEKQGHTVFCAKNGAEAWEAYRQGDHEVLITDWMMPEMDGLELCRRVRSHPSESYRYVIVLTAKSQKEDRREAFAAGADDILTKPMDPMELAARLQVATRMIDMQGQLKSQAIKIQELTTAIQSNNRRFAELMTGLPIPCITIDEEARVMEWNSAAEELFHMLSPSVWHRPLWEAIVGEEHRDEGMELGFRALAHERIDKIEWSFPQRNGVARDLWIRTFALRGPDNEIVGATIACVDVTEQKRLERQIGEQLENEQTLNATLKAQADRDGLTHLFNHRYFREALRDAVDHAKRNAQPISVVLLDVDHFKSFNDDFGHQAGDQVLEGVAKNLVEGFGPTAVVARYGGEEFVAILPGWAGEEACSLADRVRLMIEEANLGPRRVTASFGVAQLSGTMQEQELVKQADEALYAAKSQGRNRVVCFDSNVGGAQAA